METSGTSDFFLDSPSIIVEAFDRIGIRASSLTRSKIQSARRSLNLELQEWSIKGLNLWAIDKINIGLIDGVASYDVETDTVNILDCYITVDENKDVLVNPISRSDYAAISNKSQKGRPTSLWFNRAAVEPNITFWPVPDGSYVFTAYRIRRLQDINAKGGEAPDIPYRFLDALCSGLAKRLALKYKPSKYPLMKAEAIEAWQYATEEDREVVPIKVVPNLSGYMV